MLEEGGKVVFLHRIIPGGADRSYGIHVAQLAGMPRQVVTRAEEILQELETGTKKESPAKVPPQQLSLFPVADPILDELASLDLASVTPLEPIGKLFEWQKKYSAFKKKPNIDKSKKG